MVSQLHPRSRATSTLFVSTLAICFFVVGMPHILPCPAPRIAFADAERGEDGRVRRKELGPEDQQLKGSMSEEHPFNVPQKAGRECPVPKPGGKVGEMLGFTKEK